MLYAIRALSPICRDTTWCFYEGLNASYSTGDTFENVVRNRLLVLQSLGLEAYPCATLWQVHGAGVATLDVEREVWDDWRTDWAHRSYLLDELRAAA